MNREGGFCHRSLSSAPSRNLTPDLQGHAGPCTFGSLVPRPLGQCPLGRPSLFHPPDTLLYRLWPTTCSPVSTTFNLPSHYWFHIWPTLPPFQSLYSWCFRLALSLQPLAHAGFLFAGFSTLKMGAIRSSETSVHTRTTRRHISENGILHIKSF
jgi:hypothetical protein